MRINTNAGAKVTNGNMLFGLGTDIVEVDRIAARLAANPDLKNHIFSVEEQSYCESTKKPAMHYAARFAAKEAFLKAFGVTFIGNHALPEIEVGKDKHGKPFIELSGRSLEAFNQLGLTQILLSISHTDQFAVASVIIEK